MTLIPCFLFPLELTHLNDSHRIVLLIGFFRLKSIVHTSRLKVFFNSSSAFLFYFTHFIVTFTVLAYSFSFSPQFNRLRSYVKPF